MKKILSAALALIACVSFVACTPSSVEKAEKKMKDAGYEVSAYSDVEAEGLIGGFVATKGGLLDMDTITALLFESKDDAEDFCEDAGKLVSIVVTPEVDGKWVYWGSEDAIEDFTK